MANENTLKKTSQTTLWVFLLFGVVFTTLQAKVPFSRTFSFLDGLPSQTIYHLHTEPNGLLYLGTESGLFTFDGVRFTPIANPSGVTRPITDLKKDKLGRIWARNFSGQLFCLIDDTLQTFPMIQNNIGKGRGSFEFYVHPNGVYIGTPSGLFRYDFETDTLFHLFELTTERETPTHTEGLIFDPDKKVFHLINGLDAYILDESGNLLKEYTWEGLNKRHFFFEGKVLSLSKTKQPLFETYPKTNCDFGKIESKLKRSIISYWMELDGELWISTSTGLHQLSLSSCDIVQRYFSNYRISHAVRDNKGNIWIASLDNGLFVVPHLEMLYHNFSGYSDKENIVFTAILVAPNKDIVAGTTDGDIFILNPDGSYKSHFASGTRLPIEFLKYDDRNNKVIFNYGTFSYDRDEIAIELSYIGKHLSWDEYDNNLISTSAFSLFTSNTLSTIPDFIKEYPKITYEHFEHTYVLAEGRSRVNFYDAATKTYYLSTDGGFYFFNSSKKGEIRLTDKPIVVTTIVKNTDGLLWVGTANHGVMVIKGDSLVEVFHQNGGLSGNLIKGLQHDAEGNFYVLTDKGLDFITKKTGSIWNITQNLGLRGVEINNFVVSGDDILLGVQSGIISLPTHIGFETIIPTLEIVEMESKGKRLDWRNAVRIPYKQSELTFRLRSVNHKSLGEYTYEYRLLGFQDEWQTQKAQNDLLKFISLPSGDYILEVKSCVNGIYSPTRQVRFTIIPPFWQTTLFVIFVAITFLLVVYLSAKFIIQKLRQREDLRVKLALSQITALRAQMSPHFIFNVLNTIQGMIYGGQKSEASDLLGKFSELMRNTLDFSGKKTTILSREIEHLQNYIELEKQRFEEDEFTFKIQIDKILETERIEVPSMILQPFIENAIKHGLLHKSGLKSLSISFQHFEKNTLMVEIDDIGVGREAATLIRQKRQGKHKSFATSSIQQRIELMNQLMEKPIRLQVIDKKDNAGNPAGTKILIVIPYESDYS